MAEPLPRMEEVPELPPAGPRLAPERELETGNQRLNSTAEKIGNVVGSAVGTVRHLPHRVGEMKERLILIKGRAREDTASAAAQWKQAAQDRVDAARRRAANLAREYPVQVILGVAGVAFVMGILLRVWRSRD